MNPFLEDRTQSPTCRRGRGLLAFSVAVGSICFPFLLEAQLSSAFGTRQQVPRTTGTIQIIWNGGQGNGGNSTSEKFAFADFAAFGFDWGVSKGEFNFLVLGGPDLMTIHRQVTAEVVAANIDPASGAGRFLGLVVYDTKGTAGGGGGHTDGGGCSDGTHDDGGCSGGGGETGGGGCSDGTHDDGGCSDGTHDDGGCGGGGMEGGMEASMETGMEAGMEAGMEGGMGGESSGHDGGCSDGTHDDGGCSDGTHDDGGCGGGGGGSGGGSGPCGGLLAKGASGGSSRVGQIVLVEVTDGGTAGVNGDVIAWRWFLINREINDLVQLEAFLDELVAAVKGNGVSPGHWPKLCPKTVLAGNLVVHPRFLNDL